MQWPSEHLQANVLPLASSPVTCAFLKPLGGLSSLELAHCSPRVQCEIGLTAGISWFPLEAPVSSHLPEAASILFTAPLHHLSQQSCPLCVSSLCLQSRPLRLPRPYVIHFGTVVGPPESGKACLPCPGLSHTYEASLSPLWLVSELSSQWCALKIRP